MRKQLTVLQRAAEWVMHKKVFLTTGLTLPDIMLWTEHLILGTHIGQIADVGAWARGDQLNRIRAEVRDLAIKKQWTRAEHKAELAARYAALKELYKTVSVKTMLNNATTAAAWPIDTRRQTKTIGYSHHEVLNRKDQPTRDRYLDAAERNGWTVARLRLAIQDPDLYFEPAPAPLFAAPALQWIPAT